MTVQRSIRKWVALRPLPAESRGLETLAQYRNGSGGETSYFMKIWSGNVNREMTRHGRNQTASAVYSYQEKKKDSGELVNL